MKPLIIYYSYDGHSDFIAKELSRLLDADILRIEPENEKKYSGFAKYFFCGMGALFKKNILLKTNNEKIEERETVIIGGPVWGGAPAPALCAFLKQTPLAAKKTGLFLCHLSKPGQAMQTLKSLIGEGTKLIAEADFINPDAKKTEAFKDKLDVFAGKIKNAIS
ncbi:MAG: flavodoxin domain-containing protein [Spirochaetaceae bacterium]|jgi:flavodoxin|nr:flavodoxin domain-containing protein [Spirochaetaceae bacterium]